MTIFSYLKKMSPRDPLGAHGTPQFPGRSKNPPGTPGTFQETFGNPWNGPGTFRGPPERFRNLLGAPRTFQEDPHEGPKSPKSFIPIVFCSKLFAFSRSRASSAPRWP